MIHIKRFVKQAITEDNGRGDLFYDIAPDGKFTAKIVSKSNGILAGVKYAETLAQTEKIKVDFLKKLLKDEELQKCNSSIICKMVKSSF